MRTVLRRIEIIRTPPSANETIIECGKYLGTFIDKLGLPIPPTGTFAQTDKFWFTHIGWKRYGKAMLDILSKDGFLPQDEHVIIRKCELEQNRGSYADPYQIAISTKP